MVKRNVVDIHGSGRYCTVLYLEMKDGLLVQSCKVSEGDKIPAMGSITGYAMRNFLLASLYFTITV